MSRGESRKERTRRHLLEEEKIAEKNRLFALTGRVIEHGPDKGYAEIDVEKRASAEKELDQIKKELKEL